VTVSSVTNRVSYTGNGSTTAFAFSHPFRLTADLVVTVRTTATGAESLKTEGADYTVTGTADSGTGGYSSGTVTFGTAPATGTQVHIDRVVTRTQTSDFISGDGIPPASIEGSLDKITLAVQELDARFARTLLQPRTAANRDLVLPEPSSSTANKYVAVNTAGTAFELRTGSSALQQGTVYESNVTAAPSTIADPASISTAFTGDLSKQFFPVKHTITGTATAGQPTTGYSSSPEVMPFYVFVRNESGWNESTTGNDGRTGIAAHRVRLQNAGQGDLFGLWVTGTAYGTRAGSTNFLANPAATIVAGNLDAGADGVYLNPGEFLLTDSGYDAAGIGWVVNLNRTVTTGAKGAYWAGFRTQSVGAGAADVAFSASGAFRFGLDLSFCTFDSNKAAISLKADDRIYGNVTATDSSGLSRFPSAVSTTYFSYSSSLGAWSFVTNNTSSLQLYSSQVISPLPIRSDTEFRISTLKVVGARDTGWTAMTGTTNKATSYDTSTVTLAQLAGRVMALQAALTTHGLIGT
jgi:hypothetical protein